MMSRFARLGFRALVVAIALGAGNAEATQALQPGQGTRAPWHGDLQHTAWTRKDGAPSAVVSMAQDGNGLLWFAGSDSLYSFDGTRFTRNDRIHGHPLLSPVTVAVSAFGDTIWVAYQFGGISRFDRDSVRHYRPGVDAPLGSTHRILRTPDGTIWVAESRGLARLRDDRWELVGPGEGLPENQYPTISMLKDGSLLVATADGLYRRAAGAMHGAGRFDKLLGQPGIVAAMEQPDGRLLIETRKRGLELFDPASGARKPFRPRQRDAHVLGYLSDARGGLWVSMGDGVELLDGKGSLIRQFPTSSGFSAGSFTGLLSDREGNAWIATPNGIDRVRPARLSTIDLPSGFSSALGVTAGAGGAVWISEAFTPGAFQAPSFLQFPDGTRRTTAMRAVICGYRQPDGTLWFANRNSLWRVRGQVTRRWALPAEFSGSRVQSMATDNDGRLWVSLVGKGIHTFHEESWRAWNGDPELARRSAIILARDHQGRIWFGYPGDRIAVLDGGVVRRFGPEQGVAIGNTLAITAGRDRIWFGGDKGLAWFDGKRFHDIGERDADGFRGVSGIVERDGGELWLHDAGGLARIAPTELAAVGGAPGALVRAERFDHLDGHRGTTPQISPLPSLVQATDGRLWYATSSSVGHIDPGAIPRNPLAPTVLVSAIRSDHDAHVPAPGLAFPPGTNRLEIDFTATALSMPERVRFRYRLAGQDRDWRDAGNLRHAVYTNLPPGAYTFEVHAANEDGVWSPQPARAAFRIEPTFIQTPWFKLACAMAVMLAAWLLHRWRLKRVETRLLETLKVRLLERQRIARTLHDTFLQSVQALVLRMHVLMDKLPDDSRMRAEVRDVLAQAEDVIEEGRQRVRQLRVPGVRHGRLLEALGEAGRELAAASGVAFVQEVTGAARELDTDIEDELFTIGREALSNAFHHAGASRVALTLDYSADRLRLAVEDDGGGIAPDILARGAREGHWGLPGMRERARLAGGELDIDSTPAGTVVSVCIPVTTAYQGMRRA